MGRQSRFISASEIGTWCYCQRAWCLQQLGQPSALTAERIAGTRYHQRHFQTLRTARRQRAAAGAIIMVSLVLLILMGVASVRFSR
jgi:hypothetical protein